MSEFTIVEAVESAQVSERENQPTISEKQHSVLHVHRKKTKNRKKHSL